MVVDIQVVSLVDVLVVVLAVAAPVVAEPRDKLTTK